MVGFLLGDTVIYIDKYIEKEIQALLLTIVCYLR